MLLAVPLAGLPRTVWLGFLGLPFGLAAWRRIVPKGEPEITARVVPAQAWTLLGFLLFSAGVSIGLLL